MAQPKRNDDLPSFEEIDLSTYSQQNGEHLPSYPPSYKSTTSDIHQSSAIPQRQRQRPPNPYRSVVSEYNPVPNHQGKACLITTLVISVFAIMAILISVNRAKTSGSTALKNTTAAVNGATKEGGGIAMSGEKDSLGGIVIGWLLWVVWEWV